MNEDESKFSDALRDAWPVETTDLTARVAAAIGTSTEPRSEMAELLAELRAVRQEMGELRRSTAHLEDEVVRLRLQLTSRATTRITPFAPLDGFARLQ